MEDNFWYILGAGILIGFALGYFVNGWLFSGTHDECYWRDQFETTQIELDILKRHNDNLLADLRSKQ